jgi:hypothetical protein
LNSPAPAATSPATPHTTPHATPHTTTAVELCALEGNESYTLGKGRTYSAAIADARKRAASPHSLTAIALSWPSPLIRAYSRPQHHWGAIVPCEAIEVRQAPVGAATPIAATSRHDADSRSKFHLYKTARLVAAGEIVGLRFVPASTVYAHGAFFFVTPREGPPFSIWPDELDDFCL